MSPVKMDRILIGVGTFFGVYVCYALVMMNDNKVILWNGLYFLIFAAVLACGWGLWRTKAWALKLSFILAAAGLGLGLYFVHFAWTFWLFKEPSLLDRILAVLNPRLAVFTAVPLAWIYYFKSPEVRARFTA